jgi:hypothetical protein
VHRKARQSEHTELTLTDTYNVLAKMRAGDPLDEAEQHIRDMALADTLLHIHEEIDRIVMAAYGWPADLDDDAIIARLVALNLERAAEEARGIIRWLRPDYQSAGAQTQILATEAPVREGEAAKPRKPKAPRAAPWPADMPGRIRALTAVLRDRRAAPGPQPIPASAVASMLQGAKLDDVEVTLQCAAAADAVARVEMEDGSIAWMARVT